MYRLSIFIFILLVTLALGCRREPAEEAGPDTAAMHTTAVAPADSVSRWIPAGETTAVRTPNGKACLYVPEAAADANQFGDSIRITITRVSPNAETLPQGEALHAAFQSAAAGGGRVFPPVYEFHSYNADGQEFTEFSEEGEPVIIVAMCVSLRPGEEQSFNRALLARPDPANPDSLQFFEPVDPPADCQLTCEPRGSGQAARQAAIPLERWLTGSPLTATPAYAAACLTSFLCGIGGGGAGNSPFAAVDTLAGGGASAD